MTYERHIQFERVFNFRDLGGYPTADGRTTRWRRLFRSDELHLVTEAEAERYRQELALATVIDLRAPDELTRRGGLGPLVAPPTAHRLFPMWNERLDALVQGGFSGNPSGALYLEILDLAGDSIAGAVALMAEDTAYPAVFHCAAGKDRTGILAAVLLSAIGVDDATIVEDYALTQLSEARRNAHLVEIGQLRADEDPGPSWATVPAAVKEMLGTTRERHGSVAGYLGSRGVDQRTLERIGELLLE